MSEYVSLYTSGIHRLSLTDLYNEYRQTYEGEETLNLLYKYPADMSIIGEMHRHNTDFGFKEVQASNQVGCPCCKTQYRVSEQNLNVSTVHLTPSLGQIERLKKEENCFGISSQVAAFFTQAKIVIFSLLLRFIVFDLALFVKAFLFSSKIYSRVELTKHGHLVDEDYILDEQLTFPVKIIVAFYKYDIIAFQLFAMVVLLLVFFAYSHKFQFQMFEAIQLNQPNENRYAIIVENIPLIPVLHGYDEIRFENMAYQKRIRIFFKQYIKENLISKLKNHDLPDRSKESLNKLEKSLFETFQKQGPTINFAKIEDQIVQEVIICYDHSCLTRIQREKQYIMSLFLNSGTQSLQQRVNEKVMTTVWLKKLNKQHLKMVNTFSNSKGFSEKMPYFLGFAIVILNYQHYRDFLIKESLEQPSNLTVNDTNQLIIRAAEKPSVVEWSNFIQRKHEQLKTRIYTNLILLMVLLVTLVALSYLEMYKIIPMIQQWLHFPKKYQHRIKIYIISGITSLINLLLSYIIQLLADSQKRLSKTGTTVTLITKNVITQFINSALIYYLITFVTPASFLFEMKDLKRKVESLIIIPGIIRILINFLNTKYLIKKFQFGIYSQKNFQIQFNRLFERPEFDLVSKYTYYIVQILTVSFYAPLSPLIIPALMVILPIVYYVDKLILFKKSSQPSKVSFRVTDWVHFLCECSTLSFITGWILFCPDDLWSDFVEIVTYLCLIVIIIYLSYRFRMVNNVQKYFCNMKKSTKSHSECSEVLFERFKNYEPWMRYLKPTLKLESCKSLPK